MMRRTDRRLRLCVALTVLNLLFIWGNSLLPGSVSGAISQWVKDLISSLFPGVGPAQSGSGLLRKLAHFTEFSTLGASLGWLCGMLCAKKLASIGLPLLCGCMAACIDEAIQRFVPDRGPSLWDVGLDTLGVAFGIFLLIAGQAMYKTIKHKNLEETT